MDICEVMLTHGCTERQLEAVARVLDVLEKEHAALHLEIHSIRSMAHCSDFHGFARFGDAVLHSSQSILDGLRDQHTHLSRLLGKRTAERLAAS